MPETSGTPFDRMTLLRGLGWVPEAIVNPSDIKYSDDPHARGFHKMIAFDTGVVPVACYFDSRTAEERLEDRLLIIEVTQEALGPEELRVPPPTGPDDLRTDEERAQDLFPARRATAMDLKEFERRVDEAIHLAFEVHLVEAAS